MDATRALREFPTLEAARALQQAIEHDPEYIVRYHAMVSLYVIYGYPSGEIASASQLGTFWNEYKAEVLSDIQALMASHAIGLATRTESPTPYQRFWSRFITPMNSAAPWHYGGLNTTVFSELTESEKQQAETALLNRLPDWRAVQGLDALRCQQAIVPLQKLALTIDGATAIAIELALKHLGAERPQAISRLALFVVQTQPALTRMDVVRVLREFPSPAAAQVLRQTITNDPHEWVRFYAVESLLMIYWYSQKDIATPRFQITANLKKSWDGPEKANVVSELDMLIASRSIGLAPR